MRVRTLALVSLLLLPAAHAAAEPLPGDSLRATPRDTLTTRLRRPAGVAVDAFGRITVADEEVHALQRFGADGTWLDGVGALGSEPAQFRRPGGIAVLGSLGLAVLDRDNRRVVAYDQHLRLIGVIADLAGDALSATLGRVDPVAITADAGGAVRVADGDRDRVLQFDFAGGLVSEVGGFGGRAGAFDGLAALAAAPGGGWVTLERAIRPRRARRGEPAPGPVAPRARLQWLDAEGRVRSTAWVTWALADEREAALAVDAQGRVAVANGASGEVRLLSADGRPLAAIAGLRQPSALAFGGDGALWVAETGAGRVRSFTFGPRSAGD